MEKSPHFNEDATNESASVACSNVYTTVKAGHSKRMKKHVLTPEMKELRKIRRVLWTGNETNLFIYLFIYLK